MNRFGTIFSVTVFGESHGPVVGIVIDGVPAGLKIDECAIAKDISRRSSGASGTTGRKEKDSPEIISGQLNGICTGAPLTLLFRNTDIRSEDYDLIKDIPRPGHADLTAFQKFKGFNDYRGGGMFSGRMTLPIVAAGAIAKKIIEPMNITAEISEIGGRKDYQHLLKECSENGDSLGGIIRCTVQNTPAGLGEPFFNSVESLISHLVFSIPGVKGIEFGSGFRSSSMTGSQMNDQINDINGRTSTNNAGGINGGITNGNSVIFNVAFKPSSSISADQQSIDLRNGKKAILSIKGRHDTCFALRAPVIVEAVTAIVLADLIYCAHGG